MKQKEERTIPLVHDSAYDTGLLGGARSDEMRKLTDAFPCSKEHNRDDKKQELLVPAFTDGTLLSAHATNNTGSAAFCVDFDFGHSAVEFSTRSRSFRQEH